ncbi:MAG: hypothetical protein GY810_19560 [Aureispira sp.]|nr:hypothetical protein [Aureispira sp.]
MAIEWALPIWEKLVAKYPKKLRYWSFLFTHHKVKADLPQRTLNLAKTILSQTTTDINIGATQAQLDELYTEYMEPIIALQDDDWDLPDAALWAFYGSYNLCRALKQGDYYAGESLFYVSRNQGLSALDSAGLIEINTAFFERYKKALAQLINN